MDLIIYIHIHSFSLHYHHHYPPTSSPQVFQAVLSRVHALFKIFPEHPLHVKKIAQSSLNQLVVISLQPPLSPCCHGQLQSQPFTRSGYTHIYMYTHTYICVAYVCSQGTHIKLHQVSSHLIWNNKCVRFSHPIIPTPISTNFVESLCSPGPQLQSHPQNGADSNSDTILGMF